MSSLRTIKNRWKFFLLEQIYRRYLNLFNNPLLVYSLSLMSVFRIREHGHTHRMHLYGLRLMKNKSQLVLIWQFSESVENFPNFSCVCKNVLRNKKVWNFFLNKKIYYHKKCPKGNVVPLQKVSMMESMTMLVLSVISSIFKTWPLSLQLNSFFSIKTKRECQFNVMQPTLVNGLVWEFFPVPSIALKLSFRGYLETQSSQNWIHLD